VGVANKDSSSQWDETRVSLLIVVRRASSSVDMKRRGVGMNPSVLACRAYRTVYPTTGGSNGIESNQTHVALDRRHRCQSCSIVPAPVFGSVEQG